MKTYDVITEHKATFVYRIRAESEEAASAAAMELTDYEVCRADIGDIEYDMDVAEVQDEDPNHALTVHDAEAIAEAARKDDEKPNTLEREHVGKIWEDAYA